MVFGRKPVELVQNRRGCGETMLIDDYTCQSILDTLESQTDLQRVAIAKAAKAATRLAL